MAQRIELTTQRGDICLRSGASARALANPLRDQHPGLHLLLENTLQIRSVNFIR
jgi:hypothetical protein